MIVNELRFQLHPPCRGYIQIAVLILFIPPRFARRSAEIIHAESEIDFCPRDLLYKKIAR